MSPHDLPGDLDLLQLSSRLQQAGWDVFASDLTGEVAARRDPAGVREVWSLVVDHSGRWRFTATRQLEPANSREVSSGGQALRVLRERPHILTVTGRLVHLDDLPEMLDQLTQLALEEAG